MTTTMSDWKSFLTKVIGSIDSEKANETNQTLMWVDLNYVKISSVGSDVDRELRTRRTNQLNQTKKQY